MFGVKKDQLVKGLAKVSCRLCGYLGSICDCKYLGEGDEVFSGSEQTGCCETAMAATLINAMTADEFRRIAKRAQIQIHDYEEEPLDMAAEMKKFKDNRNNHFKSTMVATTVKHTKSKK